MEREREGRNSFKERINQTKKERKIEAEQKEDKE